MTMEELVRMFAERLGTGVVLTDAALARPGPLIRYANPAFCRLTGYTADELIGGNPRVLQGKDTQPLSVRKLSRSLQKGRRFHGVVSNYRKSGEHYLCEIDVRPICDAQGKVLNFIAFEREVTRGRGRPREDGLGRFKATLPEDEIFDPTVAGLSPFSSSTKGRAPDK